MLQKVQLCTLLGIPGRKKEEVMSNNFNFNNLGADLNIEIDSNNQAQCPECNCKFKYLIKHLNCVKECRIKLDFDKFKVEYQCFMNRSIEREKERLMGKKCIGVRQLRKESKGKAKCKIILRKCIEYGQLKRESKDKENFKPT